MDEAFDWVKANGGITTEDARPDPPAGWRHVALEGDLVGGPWPFSYPFQGRFSRPLSQGECPAQQLAASQPAASTVYLIFPDQWPAKGWGLAWMGVSLPTPSIRGWRSLTVTTTTTPQRGRQ